MSSDRQKEKDSGSYSSGDERGDKKSKDLPSSSDSITRDSSKHKEEKRRQKIQKIIEKEAWPARHTNKLPFKKRAALIHHGDPVMMFNVVKTNAYGKRQKRCVFLSSSCFAAFLRFPQLVAVVFACRSEPSLLAVHQCNLPREFFCGNSAREVLGCRVCFSSLAAL